jgi:glyoxylate/hydroxypyruvate reductase A
MCEYVALHVLRFHRRLPEIEAAHSARRWVQYVEPLAHAVPVGILGLGNLGAAAAGTLRGLGYQVLGWSRRGRPIGDVNVVVHSGEEGLRTVLSQSRIVVCMLPGTPATNDLLNRDRLSLMKPGAYLINIGRGETIIDADLVTLLRAGHIAGAVLDVFREEPLSADDPYWSLSNVLVTSHTASAIEPATGGRVICRNILAFDAGEKPQDLVDLEQGY